MTDSKAWDWQARYIEPAAHADLAQGDLVDTEKSGVGDRFARSRWFVVLNQSCDLARQQEDKASALLLPKSRTLLVAPAIPLAEYYADAIRNGKSLIKSSAFEKLLLWNDDWAAYLPPGPGLEVDLVVILEELYTLEAWNKPDHGIPDLSSYEEVLRARVLGLASPWAERLGWMIGRQFARVGTPDPPRDQRTQLVTEVADRISRR